ncbi:MAG TPA: hypothetical protein VFW11_00130 [Cyclobacteriaceae bacterium]|nr:hypothetical protein [Cyclobacteriaceae bacterium]
MSVQDPQQNMHQWWGTMTIDPGTIIVDNPAKGGLKQGDSCVFVKTSYQSHFVTHGTCVKRVRVIKDKESAVADIQAKSFKPIPKLKSKLNFPAGSTIVEILELDKANTPALTQALNEYNETLFNDSEWLKSKGKIGQSEIIIGMGMASIP